MKIEIGGTTVKTCSSKLCSSSVLVLIRLRMSGLDNYEYISKGFAAFASRKLAIGYKYKSKQTPIIYNINHLFWANAEHKTCLTNNYIHWYLGVLHMSTSCKVYHEICQYKPDVDKPLWIVFINKKSYQNERLAMALWFLLANSGPKLSSRQIGLCSA